MAISQAHSIFTCFQRQALEETKRVLPEMKIKIEQALERLEEELVSPTKVHQVSYTDTIQGE